MDKNQGAYLATGVAIGLLLTFVVASPSIRLAAGVVAAIVGLTILLRQPKSTNQVEAT